MQHSLADISNGSTLCSVWGRKCRLCRNYYFLFFRRILWVVGN